MRQAAPVELNSWARRLADKFSNRTDVESHGCAGLKAAREGADDAVGGRCRERRPGQPAALEPAACGFALRTCSQRAASVLRTHHHRIVTSTWGLRAANCLCLLSHVGSMFSSCATVHMNLSFMLVHASSWMLCRLQLVRGRETVVICQNMKRKCYVAMRVVGMKPALHWADMT